MLSVFDQNEERREQVPPGSTWQAADSQPNSSIFATSIATFAVLFLALISAVWSVSTIKMLAVKGVPASDAPVTLIDEVEHLPAPSWKTIPLILPYSGTVTTNIVVLHGNPINVILTTPNQFKKMQHGEWKNLKVSGGVTETGTKSYTHMSSLGRGGYYLVIGDTYIGEPPTPPSEISVRVRLNP